MVKDRIVEEVKSRADLVDICGEYTSLKRVGKSVRGPCPLHDGDDPNFSIDPDRQIFKCFVCGEGGDVFSFLMKHLGLSFPEAVRKVALRVGVEIPDEEDRGPDPHAPIREAARFAMEWFGERLFSPAGEPARSYLANRGIEEETARRYALGYAPDAWRELRDAARKQGLDDDTMMEAGLLATSQRADEPYDRFRNRLTFAILDNRDRPLGFGGRDLSGDEQAPKYINSPESPIFHKRSVLYGLNWARHQIRKEGSVLVVEGYTDVLALHARGLERAVAPLGTSLTEEQAETLSRYADRAFLLFDSDRPGLEATFRTADRLLAAGVHPMVVTLPADEDPDSLARSRGIEAVESCLGDAVDVLERKLQILERAGYLESIEGKRRAVDGLLSTLRAVSDTALRDIYLVRAAEGTGVRRATLVEEVARARGRERPRRRHGGPARPRQSERPDPEGRRGTAGWNLLLLILRDPDLLDEAREAGVEPDHFRDDRHGEIFRKLLEDPGRMEPAARAEAFTSGERDVLDRLEADPTELTHPGEVFRHAVLRLKNRPRLARLREIDEELGMADDDQALELVQEKERIARELREDGVPLSFLHRWSEPAGGRSG